MTTKSSIRVVFMGTPEFAVPSLQSLHESPDIEVAGVVTVADKPAGRGQKIRMSAVKAYAISHNLPVLQPLKLKSPEFIAALEGLKADLFCVVAFRMLPEVVWSMPPKGTINLHASLLPNYRGAAPINWAIINGESETGLTTFFIEKEIDTGKIIHQVKVPITPDETAGELHDKMKIIGAELLLKTVQDIAENNIRAIAQTELMQAKSIKPAPKLFKEDCVVDWNQSVAHVHNFIRGLSPFPTAWTTLNHKLLKLYRGTKTTIPSHDQPPGTVVIAADKMMVACSDFFYALNVVQLEGKKRVSVEEFIRGYQHLFTSTTRLQ